MERLHSATLLTALGFELSELSKVCVQGGAPCSCWAPMSELAGPLAAHTSTHLNPSQQECAGETHPGGQGSQALQSSKWWKPDMQPGPLLRPHPAPAPSQPRGPTLLGSRLGSPGMSCLQDLSFS